LLENIKDSIKELKPFYVRNVIKNIFSWRELEKILNLRPFNNQDRFKADLNETYEWPFQDWVLDINCFPPSVIKEITKKYLCHVADSSRINEKINTICGELDKITGYSTDAHIYFDLTEEQNVGFGIHYDMAHNLIVQIEGRTNIKIWNIKCYDEGEKFPKELDEEPMIDTIMEPGDVCYIPAHYYHEAKSLTKRLSISFPSHTEMKNPQEREWIRIP
jgi:ribosomal protein L16 Arg81 hydroxylase